MWLRSHGRLGAAAGGPQAQLRIFGNHWADRMAKRAADWHPQDADAVNSLARAHALSRQLCIAYAKLLEWATGQADRLPPVTPLEGIFKTPRPPPIPAHTFAQDQAGCERCVRCMLPTSLTAGRPCRPHGTLGHAIFSLGTGVFCNRCGVYSFS